MINLIKVCRYWLAWQPWRYPSPISMPENKKNLTLDHQNSHESDLFTVTDSKDEKPNGVQTHVCARKPVLAQRAHIIVYSARVHRMLAARVRVDRR